MAEGMYGVMEFSALIASSEIDKMELKLKSSPILEFLVSGGGRWAASKCQSGDSIYSLSLKFLIPEEVKSWKRYEHSGPAI